MPEMAPQQGQAPQQADAGGEGGGVSEKIVALDQDMTTLVGAVMNAPIPDEVKAAGQAALEAWRGFVEGLIAAAKGGGGGKTAPAQVSPEQGRGQAVPASPAMRG